MNWCSALGIAAGHLAASVFGFQPLDDAVASDSMPNCAQSAVYLLAGMRGIACNLDEVRSVLPVAADGTSTVGEVVTALEQLSVHVTPLQVNDWEALPTPSICRLRGTLEGTGSQGAIPGHFVVVLERNEHFAIIADPPRAIFRVSKQRFMERFAGQAIVPNELVTDRSIEAVLWQYTPAILIGTCVFSGMWLLFALWRRMHRKLPAAVQRSLRSRGGLAVAGGLVALSGIVTMQLTSHQDRRQAVGHNPRRRIEILSPLDLGQLTPGIHHITLTAENSSDRPVTIRSVTSGCSCAVVTSADVIDRGSTAELAVDLAVGTGPGAAELQIIHDAGNERFRLSWFGDPGVRVMPPRLHFVESDGGIPGERRIRLLFPAGPGAPHFHVAALTSDADWIALSEPRFPDQNEPLSIFDQRKQYAVCEIGVSIDSSRMPLNSQLISGDIRISAVRGTETQFITVPVCLARGSTRTGTAGTRSEFPPASSRHNSVSLVSIRN